MMKVPMQSGREERGDRLREVFIERIDGVRQGYG